jgi:hypothetical protein
MVYGVELCSSVFDPCQSVVKCLFFKSDRTSSRIRASRRNSLSAQDTSPETRRVEDPSVSQTADLGRPFPKGRAAGHPIARDQPLGTS